MQLHEIEAIPWLLPGLGVSLVVATVVARVLEQPLGAGTRRTWALVFSLGIVVSATLTPSRAAIDLGGSATRYCDYSRVGLAPIEELLQLGDAGLNVLLFIPLGVAIGLLPRSGRKALGVATAIMLPFAIEATQRLVPLLDRACQTADVIDNLAGLFIGLAIGFVAGWRLGPGRRPG